MTGLTVPPPQPGVQCERDVVSHLIVGRIWPGATIRPATQQFLHSPESGTFGDCHRAAWASILGLPLDFVPHFCSGDADGDEMNRRVDEWLSALGLRALTTIYEGGIALADLLIFLEGLNPGAPFILGGASANGTGHSVICCQGRIIHDPSRDGSGIRGPMSDGWWWVTFPGIRVDPKGEA